MVGVLRNTAVDELILSIYFLKTSFHSTRTQPCAYSSSKIIPVYMHCSSRPSLVCHDLRIMFKYTINPSPIQILPVTEKLLSNETTEKELSGAIL